MVQLPVPFDRSYWVIPNRLLAGYFPGDKSPERAREKLTALIESGITYVLNLMDPAERDHRGELFKPYAPALHAIAEERGVTIVTDNLPIPDGDVPSTDSMRNMIQRLESALASGGSAYVHCWGGVGRTGVVVGCFLTSQGLASGNEALVRLQQLRQRDPTSSRPSPENERQRRFVRAWRRHVGRRKTPAISIKRRRAAAKVLPEAVPTD